MAALVPQHLFSISHAEKLNLNSTTQISNSTTASKGKTVSIPKIGTRSARPVNGGVFSKSDGQYSVQKKATIKSAPVAGVAPTFLPYFWKRSDIVYGPPSPRQAVDRTYKSTYGDVTTQPFRLNLQTNEMPRLRQKSDMKICRRPVTSVVSNKSATSALPPELVTKLYNQIHHQPQDKRCMYVINNRRTPVPTVSSSAKPRGLPAVVSVYNINLAKSVKQITLESDLISSEKSDKDDEESLRPQIIHKPAPNRAVSSKSTASIPITRRSATKQPHKPYDLEVSNYLTSSSKVFKSAEAYNKLLETRQRERKERSASLRQKRENERQRRLEGRGGNRFKERDLVLRDEIDGPISFITAVNVSKKSPAP